MISNRKIYILFHGRMPSEKAASLFAVKEAEAFSLLGEDVEVVISKRKNSFSDDIKQYYKIKGNFSLKFVPVFDLFGTIFSKLAFWISYVTFSFSCFFYLFFKIKKDDLIFSNDLLPLYLCSFFSSKTFYEMHDFPESKKRLFDLLLSRIKWILIHNKWKYDKFFEIFSFDTNKVLFLRNAVSVEDFDIPMSKESARNSLNLPKDKFLIVYTGHLYSWKGVDTLAEATQFLDKEYRVIFVGGTFSDIANFKSRYLPNEKIIIVGYRKPEEMPLFQKSADLLVIPNTAKENISKYYTSPMKLFEYMASHRPILASNIPSIKEVLDENLATFFEPDNARDLAEKIVDVRKMYNEKESMCKRAFNRVSEFTWQARAHKILAFVK